MGKAKEKAPRLFKYRDSIKFMRVREEYFSVLVRMIFVFGTEHLTRVLLFFPPDTQVLTVFAQRKSVSRSTFCLFLLQKHFLS